MKRGRGREREREREGKKMGFAENRMQKKVVTTLFLFVQVFCDHTRVIMRIKT